MSVFKDQDDDVIILDDCEGDQEAVLQPAGTRDDEEWILKHEEAEPLFPSHDDKLYSTQQTSDECMILDHEVEEQEDSNTFSSNASTLYSTQSFGDESGMILEDIERLREEWRDEEIVLIEADENLFSSHGSTFCSTQSGVDDDLMMLDNNMDDDER
ncbi:MAG: hypothetical protein Q9183_006802 [Haloplaca sp. 2 TL-2023]